MPTKDAGVQEPASHPQEIVFRQGMKAARLKYYPGETVLETARRGNVLINTNCTKGFCGTCVVKLRKGAVQMRNNKALNKEKLDQGLILACQSVPIAEDCDIKI